MTMRELHSYLILHFPPQDTCKLAKNDKQFLLLFVFDLLLFLPITFSMQGHKCSISMRKERELRVAKYDPTYQVDMCLTLIKQV